MGTGAWPANGGHENGRKLPMVYAGLLLGDDDIVAAAAVSARYDWFCIKRWWFSMVHFAV